MPAGDRTGPNGEGSMTGKQMGRCRNTKNTESFNNPRGFGRGCRKDSRGSGRRNNGLGRGYGSRRYPNSFMDMDNQKSFLENEKDRLENQIDALKKRIDELEE
ncbi:MAG: DUF5320 domain-containing protein [Fusobacteriota bacterium]